MKYKREVILFFLIIITVVQVGIFSINNKEVVSVEKVDNIEKLKTYNKSIKEIHNELNKIDNSTIIKSFKEKDNWVLDFKLTGIIEKADDMSRNLRELDGFSIRQYSLKLDNNILTLDLEILSK